MGINVPVTCNDACDLRAVGTKLLWSDMRIQCIHIQMAGGLMAYICRSIISLFISFDDAKEVSMKKRESGLDLLRIFLQSSLYGFMQAYSL